MPLQRWPVEALCDLLERELCAARTSQITATIYLLGPAHRRLARTQRLVLRDMASTTLGTEMRATIGSIAPRPPAQVTVVTVTIVPITPPGVLLEATNAMPIAERPPVSVEPASMMARSWVRDGSGDAVDDRSPSGICNLLAKATCLKALSDRLQLYAYREAFIRAALEAQMLD